MIAHRSRGTTAAAPLALAAALTLAACGGAAPPQQHVDELDPMVFTSVHKPGGGVEVQVLDPSELFEWGRAKMRDESYPEAAELFSRVAELVPESRLGRAARFNAGLCFEYAGRPLVAASRYRALLPDAWAVAEAARRRFRLATGLEAAGEWGAAAAALKPLTERPLVPPDALAVRTRLGLALLEAGKLDEAQRWLKEAVRFHKSHEHLRMIRYDVHAVRARLGLARIVHRRFAAQGLRLPLDRMRTDLDRKTRLFLRAQTAYLAVVKMPARTYSLRAGLAIGKLYEELYDDLMAAEVPDNLDAEEKAIYEQELRQKLRPLLFRAAEIYRTNAEVAERFTDHNDAHQASVEAMDRVRRRIEVDLQKATAEAAAEDGGS